MEMPRNQSLSRNGPAPMGFDANPAALALSAVGDPIVVRFRATIWSHRGFAALSVIFNVSGSGVSYVAISWAGPANGTLFTGSAIRCQLYCTAAASYGVP